MTTTTLCPSCREAVAEEDEFCESCGTRLHTPPPQEGACPKCGAPPEAADADGYCTRCGNRMPRPTDHFEVEEGGMALVSDRGLRHRRNEDAGIIRSGEGFSVLVVCDGVSTTANPDQASLAAATALSETVMERLSGREPSVDEVRAALAEATAAAQAAVVKAPQDEPGGYTQAPSSTLVAVVVAGEQIVTANIGDSRAYWIDALTADGSRQLSHDDSLAEAAIAAGATAEEAYARRDAHTITHWLGADAPELDPHIDVMAVPGPGILLVCSDGLWNYFEAPATLRALMAAGPPTETPIESARRMVDAALEAGGHDNITVALRALLPASRKPPPRPEPAEEAEAEVVPAEAEVVPDGEAADPVPEGGQRFPPDSDENRSHPPEIEAPAAADPTGPPNESTAESPPECTESHETKE
jgi:serine/threonine protein phosphatase PrpC